MAEEKKLERIYNVNLTKAYEHTRTKRAIRTVKILRDFLARHFKALAKNVKLSEALNSYVWRDSMQKPPRHVKVRGVKDGDTVKAYLHDEEQTKAKKEQKTKKKDDAKKAKPKKETPAGEPKPKAQKKEPTEKKTQ